MEYANSIQYINCEFCVYIHRRRSRKDIEIFVGKNVFLIFFNIYTFRTFV